jgi:plasmid stabilization system protein ParE
VFSVEFVPAAARQVVEARDWWVENREKAPEAFDDDLDDLLVLLERVPRLVGVQVEQRPSVRRALLRRVRYHVYFTVGESAVTILAIWHASRGSDPP